MSLSTCNINRKSCNKSDPQAQLRELLNRIQTLEDYTGTISNYVNKGGLASDVTVLTKPILVKLSDTDKGLRTRINVMAGEILAEVAAEYETQSAAAALLLSAQEYADGVGATLEASVEATYETQSAAAQLLLDAKSYADGAVSSLSASVAATYETQSAAAQLLLDAKSYADGAVSALSASVSSTYETTTAAAQLLLDAQAYADGQISSASASLSASIGDVSAALDLYVGTTAPGTYASKASLTAGEINFKADKDIFFNFNSSASCRLLFGATEAGAYGGIMSDPVTGYVRIGFCGTMTPSTPYIDFSPDADRITLEADRTDISSKIMLNSDNFGTTLPTTDKFEGRLFFLKA